MDWFLYDNDLRHEVNYFRKKSLTFTGPPFYTATK